MAVLTHEGVAIGYQETPGPGGPPFVLVHDWLADRKTWDPQVEDLSRSFRCVAVDFRGFGETPAAGSSDIESLAGDVAAVIRHLQLPPAIIAGHGLGALGALLLNRIHPELVCGTVMCDPWLTPVSDGSLGEIAAQIRNAGTTAPAAPLVDGFFGASTPDALRRSIRASLDATPPERAAETLESAASLAPVLDGLLREADARPFMALWPGSPMGNPEALRKTTVFLRQEPVPAGSHMFLAEKPVETCVLLRAFVDDVERDPRLNRSP